MANGSPVEAVLESHGRPGCRRAATAGTGSLSEFIVEHYWAYFGTRDGGTAEYRVAHRPWRVAPTENVVWNCDMRSQS